MKATGTFELRRALHRRLRPHDLGPFNSKTYSQNGEDGLIAEIFRRIGTDSRFAVEFGVEDGTECNTRLLREQGWRVLQMDGNEGNPAHIAREFITPENVNELFAKHEVPYNLDLLSIDIDSNDLWVWKALDERYRPRLVVIEYNATIAPCFAQSVRYDPSLTWDGTNYFGASLLALYKLARRRGYQLVCCDANGVNAFFVREDLVDSKHLVPKLPVDAYRGPRFGQQPQPGVFLGHLPAVREFVDIDDNIDAL